MPAYRLTQEGREYLRDGLPEEILCGLLGKGPVGFADAKEKIKNFPIALQWAKKRGLVEIREGKLFLLKSGAGPERDGLRKVDSGEAISDDVASLLVERRLVEGVAEEMEKLAGEVEGREIVQLTPEMIKTGMWRKARGFAPYDHRSNPPRKIFQGKLQPYRQIINDMRQKLIGMGFQESRGPYVESEFWNFDSLFIPQDHPARTGLHDSFVLKDGSKSDVENRDVWERVRATHEFGWITGSRGWGHWDMSLARRLVLRTHTTPVSARKMSSLRPGDAPHKMFTIDRVFRRDVIDARHLIDFDQCEGIVVGEGLNFGHLIGYIKEMGKAIGAERMSFKPSYFPFTEPSLEIYAQIKGHGWVEIGGGGIMRPEVTYPLGVEMPVLAWGIGIGRLAMIKLGITDIRQLYSDDLRWLREKPLAS